MIFEATPNSKVQIQEGPGVPVRIDPNTPDAQPDYDLLTPVPFRNLQQELVGGVKAWKTSHALLNKEQIMKAYAERGAITDAEVLDLLLRSCWAEWLPGYYWAQEMTPSRLLANMEGVIKADTYPASGEALRVGSLLPRQIANELQHLGNDSRIASFRKLSNKLESVLRARTRKHETLVKLLNPGVSLRYYVGTDGREVSFNSVTEDVFECILATMVCGKKENRAAFKTAELIVYGPALANITAQELKPMDKLYAVGS
jgi:hypothetical protein